MYIWGFEDTSLVAILLKQEMGALKEHRLDDCEGMDNQL